MNIDHILNPAITTDPRLPLPATRSQPATMLTSGRLLGRLAQNPALTHTSSLPLLRDRVGSGGAPRYGNRVLSEVAIALGTELAENYIQTCESRTKGVMDNSRVWPTALPRYRQLQFQHQRMDEACRDFGEQDFRKSVPRCPGKASYSPGPVPPRSRSVPRNETVTHTSTAGAGSSHLSPLLTCDELTASCKCGSDPLVEDLVGRTVHTFMAEESNHKRYYIACHAFPCPYLGFKSLVYLGVHLKEVHHERLGRLDVEIDGGRFVFAVPKAHIQEYEQENGVGSAGLPNLRCPFDGCYGRVYCSLKSLRRHFTVLHDQKPNLPDRPRAVRVAWPPTLNDHEERGLPCIPSHKRPFAVLGATTPTIETGEEVRPSGGTFHRLHPGAMSVSCTKRRKMKRESPIVIDISSDDDGAGDDNTTRLH